MKESFLAHGLEPMSDIGALELLLYYAIPRRNTNELAHALLDTFGSLDGVFHASKEELMTVPGIGDHAATLLTLVPQIVKKSAVSKTREIIQIRSSSEAGAYLLPRFQHEQDELLLMLCLDARRSVICCCEMAHGVVNSVEASTRRIVEKALKVKASAVIIAHNHPSGFAIPSREDDAFTKSLYDSLELVGVRFLDHIIVAGDDYVSLADTGILSLYRY
jgi:DNA repair protein RadC